METKNDHRLLLSWQAPIRPHFQRGRTWHIAAACVALLLAIYAVATGAWSFLLVIVLGVIVFVLSQRQGPHIASAAIFEDGIALEERFIAWERCTEYWFVEVPGYTELHVGIPRAFDIRIQTGTVPVPALRAAIGGRCKEVRERRESAIDFLFRKLKI